MELELMSISSIVRNLSWLNYSSETVDGIVLRWELELISISAIP